MGLMGGNANKDCVRFPFVLDVDFGRTVGAGEVLARDVDARGLLATGGGDGGIRSSSSSEEQRSIISLLDLACFENRALRLGPLLGGIGLGFGSVPCEPSLLPDEMGGRDDDTDAVLDEGGLRRTVRFILSREGNGELGGGGVSVESLLADGLYSSGSSSSSGVSAR